VQRANGYARLQYCEIFLNARRDERGYMRPSPLDKFSGFLSPGNGLKSFLSEIHILLSLPSGCGKALKPTKQRYSRFAAHRFSHDTPRRHDPIKYCLKARRSDIITDVLYRILVYTRHRVRFSKYRRVPICKQKRYALSRSKKANREAAGSRLTN